MALRLRLCIREVIRKDKNDRFHIRRIKRKDSGSKSES